MFDLLLCHWLSWSLIIIVIVFWHIAEDHEVDWAQVDWLLLWQRIQHQGRWKLTPVSDWRYLCLFVSSDRKRYVSSSLGLTALSHLPKMCSSLGLFLAFCSAIQDAPPQSAALIKDLCEDRWPDGYRPTFFEALALPLGARMWPQGRTRPCQMLSLSLIKLGVDLTLIPYLGFQGNRQRSVWTHHCQWVMLWVQLMITFQLLLLVIIMM